MARQRIFLILLSIFAVDCALSADLYDYGTNKGDEQVTTVNDGYTELQFTQGFPFYGYLFTKTYINENGLLSMITPVNEAGWKAPLPISGIQDNNGDGIVEKEGADARVLIAPFWANVDVTEGGNVYYRQITAENDTTDTLERATEEVRTCFLSEFDFEANQGIVVTWDDVSFFGHDSNTIDPRNTFQLVLVSDGLESFAFFQYEEISWNAGTESNGDSEYGKSTRGATIGFNIGDIYIPLAHPRSSQDSNSQTQLGQSSNCASLSQLGVYVYKIDPTEIVEAGCKSGADLTIFPSVGSMFGGEKIFLVGPCWDSQVDIKCRFKYNDDVIQTVTGERLDEEKSTCVPEPFFLSGELTIEVSSDGGSAYQLSQTYYVSNLDRLPSSGVDRVNPTWENWDKAEMPLSVRWDQSEFDENANLSISVLVYREDGSQGPEWVEVHSISENATNNGVYEFEGSPESQVFEDNAFGAIRIRSAEDTDGRTLWSDVHTLGYVLNQEYQDNPEIWSRTQCDDWAEDDDKLDEFVDDVLACPCTLQQAIVDTGRFQPDVSCSMYDGSKCLYHAGAKHCVRSVAATQDTHSGTQCCYNQRGDLMYSGDTDQGSTSDRSHIWGAEPYQEANMVPGLSHWKNDIVPFYFCCIWGDDCKTYLERRPTADCKEYQPPKTSATFGDPHFVTFDGAEYTFNGKGEFTMVTESDSGYELQGRAIQAECPSCENITKSNATVLSAVAMQEKDSDTINVELNPITELKFTRKVSGRTEVVDFHDQEWLDFNGVSVIVVESGKGKVHKATVTFWESGIGVNVTANGQTLAVAVSLPPSLKGKSKVKGLLGNWDDSKSNDLVERDGTKLNPETATPQQILDFGITWEIENSLFNYESGSHDDYQDNSFVPLFSAPDRSTLPTDLVQDMDRICGNTAQCLFDVSITQDISVGEYTMKAINNYKLASEYTEAAVACPYLQTPKNGTKTYTTDQENYLAGAEIKFDCDEGLEIYGPAERTCQNNGKWTGDRETECIVPGEKDNDPQASTNTVGIAVGVVVAIIVVAVIVVVIIYFVVLRKKNEEDAEAGDVEKEKTKKDYKGVKMSDVEEGAKDEAPPAEDEALNLEEATGAPKSEDD